MESLKIELLNPKAKKLLNSMKELNLIRFSTSSYSKKKFLQLLSDLRKDEVPALNKIQAEVKAVRKESK